MGVRAIDHVAIPISNVEGMKRFYEYFGFKWDEQNAPMLYAAKLDSQKLNFHSPRLWQQDAFTLRAPNAQIGCGDFCFVWEGDVSGLIQKIKHLKLEVETGPVERLGGNSQLGQSVYVRDPDGNLVEFISYPATG